MRADRQPPPVRAMLTIQEADELVLALDVLIGAARSAGATERRIEEVRRLRERISDLFGQDERPS